MFSFSLFLNEVYSEEEGYPNQQLLTKLISEVTTQKIQNGIDEKYKKGKTVKNLLDVIKKEMNKEYLLKTDKEEQILIIEAILDGIKNNESKEAKNISDILKERILGISAKIIAAYNHTTDCAKESIEKYTEYPPCPVPPYRWIEIETEDTPPKEIELIQTKNSEIYLELQKIQPEEKIIKEDLSKQKNNSLWKRFLIIGGIMILTTFFGYQVITYYTK